MGELKPEDTVAFVIIDGEEISENDTLVAELVESVETASSASLKTERVQARAELEIVHLRDEVERLKDRLAILAARTKATVAAQTSYVSNSAHAQLGDYPWLKLAAAASAAWLAGRLVRR